MGVKLEKIDLAPYGFSGPTETTCAPPQKNRSVRLCVTRPAKPGPQFTQPEHVCRYLRGVSAGDREVLYAIHLDAQNRPIGLEEVARGALSSVATTPREVFKAAVVSNAASVILAHNHPSGITRPSADDLNMTENIVKAGKLMDIPVRDHVVVGDDGNCLSMLSERLVPGLGGLGAPARGKSGELAGLGAGAPRSLKIASVDPATMTAGQINKELDKLRAEENKVTDEFIATGRGSERPSEYLRKDDPLSRWALEVFRRKSDLVNEVQMRMGPGYYKFPSHETRFFKPRKKAGVDGLGGLDRTGKIAAGVVGGAVVLGVGFWWMIAKIREANV